MDSEKFNVYQMVTDNIIALMDKGVVPWQKPWSPRGSDVARNADGRAYRGVNIFLLAVERMIKGYKSNTWMTFRHVADRGGKVNEGEHGTRVIFWKVGAPMTTVDPDTGKIKTSRPFLLRYFTVFSLDQTTGVKLTKKQQAEADALTIVNPDPGTLDEAEAILASYLVRDGAPAFTEGGDAAFYLPKKDAITVPARAQFHDLSGFYATCFHEVGHSTGHSTRCNRKGIENFDHFGSDQYSLEELVAEFTAAFLAAEAGVDTTIENNAAYIANWSARFKADPKLIVQASGQAQRAADLVLGTVFEKASEAGGS